tara:strand:- start:259 stop:843 length:585 start_codon:yes stop_codon:yes gene_type:complete
MANYFYFRCSTQAQDPERQKIAAKKAGVKESNIYGDSITGTSAYGDRPEYSKMVAQLKPGDCVITEDLTRYGRSMVLMLVEINKLLEMGVDISTLDKRLCTKSMPKEIVKLIVSVMGYASECELLNLKHRTSEGRAVAVARGQVMGRKKSYDEFQVAEVMEKRSQGQGLGTIAKALGMSRSKVQRIVKKQEVMV